jgi:hypothetical protein
MGLVGEAARGRDRRRRLPRGQHPSRPADSQIDLKGVRWHSRIGAKAADQFEAAESRRSGELGKRYRIGPPFGQVRASSPHRRVLVATAWRQRARAEVRAQLFDRAEHRDLRGESVTVDERSVRL